MGEGLQQGPVGGGGNQLVNDVVPGMGEGGEIPETNLVWMRIFLVNSPDLSYNGINGDAVLILAEIAVQIDGGGDGILRTADTQTVQYDAIIFGNLFQRYGGLVTDQVLKAERDGFQKCFVYHVYTSFDVKNRNSEMEVQLPEPGCELNM